MARTRLIAVLMLAAAATPAQATRTEERPLFAASPVSQATLAQVHGTGSSFADDFRLMLGERARIDERTFGTVNAVAMDGWWAYVGSELIAANLTR